jgi:hypothetical protein
MMADLSFLQQGLDSVYSTRSVLSSAFLTSRSNESSTISQFGSSPRENGVTPSLWSPRHEVHQQRSTMIPRCSCGAKASVDALTAAAESKSSVSRSSRLQVRGEAAKIEAQLEEALAQSHIRLQVVERQLAEFRGRETSGTLMRPVEIVAGLDLASLFSQESAAWSDIMQKLAGVVHKFCVVSGAVLERTRVRIVGVFQFAARMIQVHRLAVQDTEALLHRKSYRAVFQQRPHNLQNKCQGIIKGTGPQRQRESGVDVNNVDASINNAPANISVEELAATATNTAEYLQMMANAKARIETLEQSMKEAALEISRKEMRVLSPTNSTSGGESPLAGGRRQQQQHNNRFSRRNVLGTRHRYHVRALIEDLGDIVSKSKASADQRSREDGNNALAAGAGGGGGGGIGAGSDEGDESTVLPRARVHHAEAALKLLREAHEHLSLLTRSVDDDEEENGDEL